MHFTIVEHLGCFFLGAIKNLLVHVTEGTHVDISVEYYTSGIVMSWSVGMFTISRSGQRVAQSDCNVHAQLPSEESYKHILVAPHPLQNLVLVRFCSLVIWWVENILYYGFNFVPLTVNDVECANNRICLFRSLVSLLIFKSFICSEYKSSVRYMYC